MSYVAHFTLPFCWKVLYKDTCLGRCRPATVSTVVPPEVLLRLNQDFLSPVKDKENCRHPSETCEWQHRCKRIVLACNDYIYSHIFTFRFNFIFLNLDQSSAIDIRPHLTQPCWPHHAGMLMFQVVGPHRFKLSHARLLMMSESSESGSLQALSDSS